MFGIGGGEFVLILIVVLLAVGPDQMPKMLKTVGGGLRQMRKATRELQSTVGLDEILGDTDVRDPLGLKQPVPKPKPMPHTPAPERASRGPGTLDEAALSKEQPVLGVDLELAYARAEHALASRLEDAHVPPDAEREANL